MSQIICLSLAYILGIIFAKLNILPLQYSSIGLFLFIILIVADIFIFYLAEDHLKSTAGVSPWIFILTAFLFAGAFLTNIHIFAGSYNSLKHFNNREILIEGTVSSFPQKNPDKIAFNIKTKNLTYGKKKYKIHSKIKVSIKSDVSSLPEIHYAEKIKIKGRFNISEGPDFPGGFDYEKYLSYHGIKGIVYAKEKNCIEITGKDIQNPILAISYIARQKIFKITSNFIPEPEGSLLLGILIGERFTLPEKLEEAFINTGTLHVLAASGLNVGVLIIFCLWAGNLFRLNRKISAAASMPIIIIYTFCAGASPSIVRAAIMGIFALVALIIDREKEILHSIFLSAIFILIYNPLWLFDVSFQLSYISIIGIFYLTPVIDKKLSILPKFIRLPLSVSLSAQLALYPIIAYYFYRISIISIIANLIIVPLVEFLLPCGLLMNFVAVFFKPLGLPLAAINWSLSFLTIKAAYFFENLPFASMWVGRPNSLFILIYFMALIALFFHDGISKILKISKENLCVAVLSSITVYFLIIFLPAPLKITFLNVKNGDSIFIELPTKQTILIDTGYEKSPYGHSKDAAEKIILPYLHFRGINKINFLIISHPHSDHTGGLLTILKNIKVEKVITTPVRSNSITYIKAFEYIRGQKIPVIYIHTGQMVKFNKNLSLTFLHPPEQCLKNTANDLNNNSIVTSLKLKKINFLFAGDIEKEAEDYLVKRNLISKCNVLKVAHQGSKTSSGKKFLYKCLPEYAVISVSNNNPKHPSKETLKKLKKINSKIYLTSRDGTIIFVTNGENLKIIKSYEDTQEL